MNCVWTYKGFKQLFTFDEVAVLSVCDDSKQNETLQAITKQTSQILKHGS